MSEENNNDSVKLPDTPSNNQVSNQKKPITQQPKEQKVTMERRVERYHFGPLPTSEDFGKYESVLPGAADRILAMAENEAKHRHSKENEIIDLEHRNSRFGLWCGLAVALVTIGCGTACILAGYTVSGTLINLGSLTSLVSVFVYGSRQKERLGRINRPDKNG